MKNGFFKNAISAFAALSIMASMPLNASVSAEETAITFKVSSTEKTVGNDVWVDITSVGDVGFSSGKFCLHYNNEVLEYKGNDDGLKLPASSDIKQDDISVTDDNQGITYIIFTVENINNADISFGFNAIAPGSSEMTLEVNELFDQNDQAVNYTVDNGSVTINAKETTTTTTEITTTSTSTSTETTSTVTSSSDSSSTSTNTETSASTNANPSSETTSTASTDSDTTSSSSTTQSTPSSSTSNTVSTSQSTTSTSSTTKNTTTTKSTTTTKTTTTTSNNKNSNGSVDTGDNFPVALLLTAVGVAGVALVTTSPRKKDEK